MSHEGAPTLTPTQTPEQTPHQFPEITPDLLSGLDPAQQQMKRMQEWVGDDAFNPNHPDAAALSDLQDYLSQRPEGGREYTYTETTDSAGNVTHHEELQPSPSDIALDAARTEHEAVTALSAPEAAPRSYKEIAAIRSEDDIKARFEEFRDASPAAIIAELGRVRFAGKEFKNEALLKKYNFQLSNRLSAINEAEMSASERPAYEDPARMAARRTAKKADNEAKITAAAYAEGTKVVEEAMGGINSLSDKPSKEEVKALQARVTAAAKRRAEFAGAPEAKQATIAEANKQFEDRLTARTYFLQEVKHAELDNQVAAAIKDVVKLDLFKKVDGKDVPNIDEWQAAAIKVQEVLQYQLKNRLKADPALESEANRNLRKNIDDLNAVYAFINQRRQSTRREVREKANDQTDNDLLKAFRTTGIPIYRAFNPRYRLTKEERKRAYELYPTRRRRVIRAVGHLMVSGGRAFVGGDGSTRSLYAYNTTQTIPFNIPRIPEAEPYSPQEAPLNVITGEPGVFAVGSTPGEVEFIPEAEVPVPDTQAETVELEKAFAADAIPESKRNTSPSYYEGDPLDWLNANIMAYAAQEAIDEATFADTIAPVLFKQFSERNAAGSWDALTPEARKKGTASLTEMYRKRRAERVGSTS